MRVVHNISCLAVIRDSPVNKKIWLYFIFLFRHMHQKEENRNLTDRVKAVILGLVTLRYIIHSVLSAILFHPNADHV